jgi:hypothetical protein
MSDCTYTEGYQFTNEEFIDEGNVMNRKKQKKQSLVELVESLGFTRAADDDPIYTEGIVIVGTVGAELERLEQEEANQELPKKKP